MQEEARVVLNRIDVNIIKLLEGMEELLEATREAQAFLNASPAVKFQKAMMRRGNKS